jgi:PAS domain S-box-containing protein
VNRRPLMKSTGTLVHLRTHAPWTGLTLAAGLLVSALVSLHAWRDDQQVIASALQKEAYRVADAATNRLGLYQYGLYGLAAAVQAFGVERITPRQFRDYTSARDLDREFPGARGFGLIRRVAAADEPAFVAHARTYQQNTFAIHGFAEHAGDRLVVQYIEPAERNAGGVGLDIGSENYRRQAAENATLKGAAQLTAPITLVQDHEHPRQSFLMLVPLYRGVATPATLDQRIAASLGWTYVPLVIGDVLEGLDVDDQMLHLEFSDVTAGGHGIAFYAGPGVFDDSPGAVTVTLERPIYGRVWSMRFSASSAFVDSVSQASPWWILGLGTVASVLLAMLVQLLKVSRQRQRVLLSQQARLASIVESSADAIIGMDLHGIVTSWNRGAERVFGERAGQALGRPIQQMVHPEALAGDVDSLGSHLQQVARGEVVSGFDTLRRRSDRRRLQVAWTLSPIYAANGEVIGVSKTLRDISEQMAAEAKIFDLNQHLEAQVAARTAELQLAKNEADAANRAKSSFLASMSHEIRTPMNAVLGMLHLVLHTELSVGQHDFITKAQTAARLLLGLLNDILDYSKIEAGKLLIENAPFDLDLLLQELAVVLAGNQTDDAVDVVYDIDPRLPGLIIGDRLRLQQILINLTGNALKFTRAGQIVLSIGIEQRGADHIVLRFAVEDSGIGMSEDQLRRIFEAFTQAEASISRRFGGSGLGLQICQRLTRLMGSELNVRSHLHQGSRFWFDIRFALGEQPAVTPALPASLNVLVIDDNPIAADILMRVMHGLGWRAQWAASAAAAWTAVGDAHLAGHPYDALLMDWQMPDTEELPPARTGFGARHPWALPPVVAMTAHAGDVLAQAHSEGPLPFAALLAKPATASQLAHSLAAAVQGTALPPPSQRIAASPSRERLAGLRLLLVEDNPVNQLVASAMLRAEGARVELAGGGMAAVSSVMTDPQGYDAVLMDVQMPDIDGLEATRRIRHEARFDKLPIIAMTANVSEAARLECLAAGMNEHIGKPIDLERLVTLLTDFPGTRRSTEA